MTSVASRSRFLSSYEWTKDRKDFGGYSGLVLSKDGSNFILLSDRGHLIEGTLLRHEDRILGVRSRELKKLDIPRTLFESKPKFDTEGIALSAKGEVYVSIEHENRIAVRDTKGKWTLLPAFSAILDLPKNNGIEALALTQDGGVIAIPEASHAWNAPFPVFRYDASTGWRTVFQISRDFGLLPVGADVDAQGNLYVLERGFSGFGFFSQVRRFSRPTGEIEVGELILRSEVRRHDNLEGLAVWQTPEGETRLTMVSDDNFKRFQKTEIVDYAVLD